MKIFIKTLIILLLFAFSSAKGQENLNERKSAVNDESETIHVIGKFISTSLNDKMETARFKILEVLKGSVKNDTIDISYDLDSINIEVFKETKLVLHKLNSQNGRNDYILSSTPNISDNQNNNDNPTFEEVLSLAQVLFYFLIPIVSFLTYFQAKEIAKNTSSLNKNSKKVDVMMVFHKRYDELKFEKEPMEKQTSVDGELTQDLKNYYYRFWNLQLDQWQYSKLDFLDDEIYSHWLNSRRLEWKSLDEYEKNVYKIGLEYAMKMIGNEEFKVFIYKVVFEDEKISKLIKLEKRHHNRIDSSTSSS
jgi:hypothetical protein